MCWTCVHTDVIISLTWIVPAAPGGASSPPAALKHHSAPEPGGVLAESVRRQITDLQPGELTQELLERHPDRQTDRQTDGYSPRPLHELSCVGSTLRWDVLLRPPAGSLVPFIDKAVSGLLPF